MGVDLIKKEILESIQVKHRLLQDSELLKKILQIAEDCADSLKNRGKIIFCGNGGSFADAQHLAAEFTSRFLIDRPALASIALGTNSSGITAMANDYSFESVFSRELEALATHGDIFIGISTSGNSPNIINAFNSAKELGLKAFILTGESGGRFEGEIGCISIPSSCTPRIQESHILVGHIICGFVEKYLFGSRPLREEL